MLDGYSKQFDLYSGLINIGLEKKTDSRTAATTTTNS
jgi:hypothetical protein